MVGGAADRLGGALQVQVDDASGRVLEEATIAWGDHRNAELPPTQRHTSRPPAAKPECNRRVTPPDRKAKHG